MNIRVPLFQDGKGGTHAIFFLPETQKQEADGPSFFKMCEIMFSSSPFQPPPTTQKSLLETLLWQISMRSQWDTQKVPTKKIELHFWHENELFYLLNQFYLQR